MLDSPMARGSMADGSVHYTVTPLHTVPGTVPLVPAYDMSYTRGEWRVVSHAFMRDECCGTSTVYTSRGEQASYYQVKDEKS